MRAVSTEARSKTRDDDVGTEYLIIGHRTDLDIVLAPALYDRRVASVHAIQRHLGHCSRVVEDVLDLAGDVGVGYLGALVQDRLHLCNKAVLQYFVSEHGGVLAIFLRVAKDDDGDGGGDGDGDGDGDGRRECG